MFTHIQGSLQSFIASSPDFHILTTSEQRSLLHRNLPGVLGFGSIFFFHRADSLCFNLLARIYEPRTVASLNTIHQRFDLDSTSIKVFLLVLTFSSNCSAMPMVNEQDENDADCLLLGTYRLLGSQNVYVELLWKYLIAHHGYSRAVHQFTRLIEIVLYALKNLSVVPRIDPIQPNMDDGDDGSSRSVLSNGNLEGSLWGRTFSDAS